MKEKLVEKKNPETRGAVFLVLALAGSLMSTPASGGELGKRKNNTGLLYCGDSIGTAYIAQESDGEKGVRTVGHVVSNVKNGVCRFLGEEIEVSWEHCTEEVPINLPVQGLIQTDHACKFPLPEALEDNPPLTKIRPNKSHVGARVSILDQFSGAVRKGIVRKVSDGYVSIAMLEPVCKGASGGPVVLQEKPSKTVSIREVYIIFGSEVVGDICRNNVGAYGG